MLQELARANRRRLLAFCRSLQARARCCRGPNAGLLAAAALHRTHAEPNSPLVCCVAPLQAEVGTAALDGLLARRLLGPHEQQLAGLGAGAPGLDYHGALALAASCALAADGCAGRARGGGAAQVPWPLYLIGTRDSFTHHLVPVRCGRAGTAMPCVQA